MAPVFQFTRTNDANFYRERWREMHQAYYQPRRYFVHQRDTTPLNIYGEPGNLTVNGTDGTTSVPATRTFTSVGSNFSTAGVQATDVLEIVEESCNDGDNGRYSITVVTPTVLTINEDWPTGSLSNLRFTVKVLKERFVEFAQTVAFHVKLDPTEKELLKWGIDEKRHAKVVFSIELASDLGLTPKIGDRFEYPYEGRDIQYEIKNLFEDAQLGDDGTAMTYVGFATRTTNINP